MSVETMPDNKQEKTVAFFSRWAKTYEGGPLDRWFFTVHREVIRSVDPKPTDTILDVACGTGRALRAMAPAANAGRLVGVDLSDQMIEQAAAKAGGIPNLEFQVAGADQLPFDDETFDHVTVMNAFHHFSDQPGALREMIRVLKKGGTVHIADITGHVLHFPVAGHKVWNLIERTYTPQVNAYSRRGFRKLFQEAGLGEIRQLPASQAHRRCGRYWLWASGAQLIGGFFWPVLFATGAVTGAIGAAISFPFLSKTITTGRKID